MTKFTRTLWFPIVLVFYEIATYLSNDMYLPSLPTLADDLHISDAVAGYTLLLWFLGSASMQLLMGPLSDRFGRKGLLIFGGVFYIAASFICALTANIPLFLLARFIQGSAVCSVVVAGYAAVHELYDTTRAIKLIAIMGSITVLAPAFGPLMGAIVLEVANWRAIFYFLGVYSLLTIILLMKVMPETNQERISLNLKQIGKDYLAISLRKSFLTYMLPFCFLFLSFICWVVESPFIIIESYQKTAMEYGWIQLLVFGSFIVGAQITRVFAHKVPPIELIKKGLLIALLAAIMLMIFSFIKGVHFYVLVGTIMVLSMGAAIAFAPLNRCAIDCCQEPMGRVMAIFSTYMNVFGVIATWLVVQFNDKAMNDLSLLMAFGVIVAFLIFYTAIPFQKASEAHS